VREVLNINSSELGMVLFVFALVALAGKLPQLGEAVGGYLYRRRTRRPGG
jgi:Sec-independent protein translocase protein TatA